MTLTQADAEFREALIDYLARLHAAQGGYGKLDSAYRRSGRRARRLLKRCVKLAYENGLDWRPPREAVRTYY